MNNQLDLNDMTEKRHGGNPERAAANRRQRVRRGYGVMVAMDLEASRI